MHAWGNGPPREWGTWAGPRPQPLPCEEALRFPVSASSTRPRERPALLPACRITGHFPGAPGFITERAPGPHCWACEPGGPVWGRAAVLFQPHREVGSRGICLSLSELPHLAECPRGPCVWSPTARCPRSRRLCDAPMCMRVRTHACPHTALPCIQHAGHLRTLAAANTAAARTECRCHQVHIPTSPRPEHRGGEGPWVSPELSLR